MQICPKCGQTFDGDKCWVCVARLIDIKETFLYCLPVACVGLLGLGATASYTPLQDHLLKDFLLSVTLVIPAAVLLLLVYFDRLTRYAVVVRLMLILAAATPIMSATFLYMNGAWDQEPPVETQAFVSYKHIVGPGKWGRGPAYYLHVTLHWKESQIDGDLLVPDKTYNAAEPNDSVSVIVHPGELSLPWYSDVILIDQRRNPRQE
jgi:hypothetical protein